MTDQPYQGGPYEGYDPYQQQHWPAQEPQYGQQPGHDPELTQQWQGQTWETQTHAPVQAPETAYLPRQEQQPHPQQAPQQQPYQQHQQQSQQEQPYQQHQQQPFQEPHYQQQHEQQARYQQGQQVPEPHAQQYGQEHSAHQPYAHAQAPVVPAPVAESPEEPAEPAGAAAGPAYGPATLAGNARITDAQRARLEGRSPVIEPGMQPALLTAGLGLLLAVAAPVTSYALVVPLVLLQAVTAAGWFRLNGMWPARQGIALAFAGALTADAAVLATGRDHALVAILGSLGLWVLLSLALQLRSHASPDERMYGLMATVASAALAVLATGFLAADPHAVSVGAAAVAVAVLARALPLPTPASVVVALLAAAGAGIAVGGMTDFGTKGALLGGAAAACALIGHRAASYDYPSRFVHFTAGVSLPLSAAAPVVWVLGRALG
ncbi:hypothetical protein GT045_23445 [Streptomyces sp. SID486]|uniref:hypothetical protein n=1 Tax=Streptomyces sp. SID486 TaxID=2690264 RepID=UPI0013700FEF|nr:hypothetical protein [Streptomyces sp. SID486]MYX97684.1 hypothetical protein [Streptomyces sp. SID486]